MTRNATIGALNDFYARAMPDKIDGAANIADKYEGFEELLFKRLEKQYPGHTVVRPDKKHPAANNDDDANKAPDL